MKFNWKNNVIELGFDGKLAIKIEKTEDGIKVVGAMDGYGNSILDKVKEFEHQAPPLKLIEGNTYTLDKGQSLEREAKLIKINGNKVVIECCGETWATMTCRLSGPIEK